jgi:phospholipid/cholesterol/gamma-HCH transport system substrate-binding protein
MEPARRQALRVGALAAVSLSILAATVLYIGQEQRIFENKVRYVIQFHRTNGLQVGAPVSLTGVVIGNVEAMAFPRDVDAQYIAVHIRVAGNVAPRIRENSIATLRTLGLLGDKFVELTAGTTEAQPLKPGSVIASLDPIDYEEVLGQSGDIITNVIEVTASLKNVLQSIDRGEGLLGELVKNRSGGGAIVEDVRTAAANIERSTATAARIVERIEHGEGVLGALVKDSDRMDRILARVESASTSLERFTLRLQNGSGTLPRLLDDEAYARAVLGDVERTTANLAEISDKVNRGDGTIGALVNDPTLYRRVNGIFTGGSGWMFSLYRGVQSLWPFGDGVSRSAGTPLLPAAEPTAGTPPSPDGDPATRAP